MSFGSRLRQERGRLELTQQKFAELGGVKRVSQHLYEQDARVPDMNYLMRLKEGGVDVWFLINGARFVAGTGNALPRSVYVSAFRAVDELARNADGQVLPLEERERLFDFLLTLLQNEHSSASLEEIKSRVSGALVA
ncbi:helix-turn-helix transcriptional regulator [Pseudoxanthomonas sp. PXM02]|uniref:helix-turn-helix domain-containing protein n=1 Tax=Pseudoxanthomonas sp. PXM02 TaxID=2769294 RepID=UPI001784ED38|nr:helix-turn-helix transcriptional regulator [Pseudoxanthomonas sp. PXM02]MBD9479056.1 helix-turn-helix transcriptional regulator [Pseudoxanthomonas sp. PXM02]